LLTCLPTVKGRALFNTKFDVDAVIDG